MKIRQMGAELFHADGQKGRHDEDKSSFSQFCERDRKCAQKIIPSTPLQRSAST